MLTFFKQSIPNCAHISQPLYSLLKNNPKSHKQIILEGDLLNSFFNAKSALKNATLLSHYNPNSELVLYTDASDSIISGALSQINKENNVIEPLSFYSKSLNTTQQKYSIFSKELLAVFNSIQYFRYYLEGRRFTVFTDNLSLVQAYSKLNNNNLSTREMRQLAFISEFEVTLTHISSAQNVCTDALSRLEINLINLSESFLDLN